MIHLSNIQKVFNTGKPSEFVALDNVSLTINAQQVTVLKGPSGSGKTTLLSIVGCMSRPTAGRIMLREREITSMPERFLTEIRRKTFGFIFQQNNLIKGLTALENVMLPTYPTGEKFGSARQRAMGLLDLFGLLGRAHQAKVEWLSGGEIQRVAIARALINNPSIIVADEPTAHLDTKLSEEFMKIVQNFKEEGKTVIIASHDPIVHNTDTVDRVFEMRDGQILSPEKKP